MGGREGENERRRKHEGRDGLRNIGRERWRERDIERGRDGLIQG